MQDDAALVAAVQAGDRRGLARAITLIESTRADHRVRGDALLNALLSRSGQALRLGVSGVPGVGKSTFIEALGLALIALGHRVAVLTIDPSSTVSGGSILGDKTRMERLSMREEAYIRPSPSSGTLGGVAEKSRETMLVCEAAGYDIVIVETVGVGQSETAVAGMTDLFLLLQLPNAGDDLQAMKKGIMELADLVIVNKADLDPLAAARAEHQVRSSLPHATVLGVSALTGQGMDALWQTVERMAAARSASGEFAARRRQQSLAWLWDIIHSRLQADFRAHRGVSEVLPQTLREVEQGRIAPSVAARALLGVFEGVPVAVPANS